MFNIAICDDDVQTRELLREYLECLEAEGYKLLIHSFKNGYELKEYYQNGHVDLQLILLDMEMPGCDGIAAASCVREFDTEVPIIAVTAHDSFAIPGYKVMLSSYLLKPVAGVLDKQQLLAEVRQLLNEQKEVGEFFTYMDGWGWHKIMLKDIYYFQTEGHQLKLHKKTGYGIVNMALRDVAERLRHAGFMRVHKSYAVNLMRVVDLEEYNLILDNGVKVQVGKHRRCELKLALMHLVTGGRYGA